MSNEIKYDKGSGEPDKYGDKYWYINGKRHREDGPACEYADGENVNGKLHREDGPAVEYANGDKFWYLNGKLHRTDGPAIEWDDGEKEWFLDNKQAIKIFDQEIKVGKSIEIEEDIGIVLKHIEGIFWSVLIGNQKILVV